MPSNLKQSIYLQHNLTQGSLDWNIWIYKIRNNNVLLIKPVLMWIISHQVYNLHSTNNPVYWLSFRVPLQPGKVNSCLITLILFFDQRFFCFVLFHWLFWLLFCCAFLFCFGLIWFLLVLVVFSWSCCNSLLSSDFFSRRFVRVTNLNKNSLLLC